MNCRTTLVDVAARANCSKSTASLSLRNDPRIPETTRQRVQACAKELNYRPDPALAFIAARRWQSRTSPSGSVVAFITSNHPHGIFLDEAAMKGARGQAEEFGYRLEHFKGEDYKDPAHMARVIQHRGIRGIIMGKLMSEDFLVRFPWAEFCGVACDTGFYKPPLHMVMPDHSHAVKRAFNEAYQRGYGRIGLVLFNEPNAIDDFDKVSAFLYCGSFLPPRFPRIPVARLEPGDQEALARWFKEHKPDCVLGLNSYVAWSLRQNGVRVPGQVGFVALMSTLDKDPEALRYNAELTTLDHCPELLGRTALEQLDILLRTNHRGVPAQPVTMMVEACWNEAATLPWRQDGKVVEQSVVFQDPVPAAETAAR
jgi:LacI family transcriptional regulator